MVQNLKPLKCVRYLLSYGCNPLECPIFVGLRPKFAFCADVDFHGVTPERA